MAITDRSSKYTKEAQQGFSTFFTTTSNGSTLTSPAYANGFFSFSIKANVLGTTIPGTLESIALPTGVTDPLRLSTIHVGGSLTASTAIYLTRLYEIGTLVLSATGDQFTHHAATFPVTRTIMGQASQPLTLLPLLQVTVAGTTTPPVVRLRTAAGAAGYTDQDGNSTVGTKTMTFQSATTGAHNTMMFRLEDGDSGVRDISAIEVTTAQSGSPTARIWGAEIICPVPVATAGLAGNYDAFFGGLTMADLTPAVATSGTANSTLVLMAVSTVGGENVQGYISAVRDS